MQVGGLSPFRTFPLSNREAEMKRYRCSSCGYEVVADEPPDVCPVCGAPKDMFEEVPEDE